MATFISKYRNYGIKLADGSFVRFRDHSFTTSDPKLISSLSTSSAFKRDYDTSDPLPEAIDEKGGKK